MLRKNDPFKLDVVEKGFLAGLMGIVVLYFALFATAIWAVIKVVNWLVN